MGFGPYRTPPARETGNPPIRNDDSALPIVALSIVLVALAPPLTYGMASLWLRNASCAPQRRVGVDLSAAHLEQSTRSEPR